MTSTTPIEYREQDGFIVFSLPTYFDGEVGGALQKQVYDFLHKGRTSFIIDFESCQVINSPGISSLLDLSLKCVDDFLGNIVLANVDKYKVTVFTLVGIIPLIPHAPSVQEAVTLYKKS